MRTVRSSGHVGGRGCLPRGRVSTLGVYTSPPVDRMTDACENITFRNRMSWDMTKDRYLIAQSQSHLNEHQTAAVKGLIISHCDEGVKRAIWGKKVTGRSNLCIEQISTKVMYFCNFCCKRSIIYVDLS